MIKITISIFIIAGKVGIVLWPGLRTRKVTIGNESKDYFLAGQNFKMDNDLARFIGYLPFLHPPGEGSPVRILYIELLDGNFE